MDAPELYYASQTQTIYWLPVSGADFYLVSHSTNGTNWNDNWWGGSVTTIDISDLPAGTHYFRGMSKSHQGGSSPFGNTLEVTL